MAYKVQLFYNVEAPVGTGQANKPNDVMLVQYFLVKIASKSAGEWTPPSTKLDVNGTYTPALGEWIKSYQTRAELTKDGIVHPQVNPHWKVAGTIVGLNGTYRAMFGGTRHDNIVKEADLPAALKTALAPANAKPNWGPNA